MDAFNNISYIIHNTSNSILNNIDITKQTLNNDPININIIKWHVYIAKSVKWLQAPLITILDKELLDYSNWAIGEHNKLVKEATQTTDIVILEALKKRIETFEIKLATYLIDIIERRNKTGILHSRNFFETAILDITKSNDKEHKIVLRDLLDYFMNSNQFKKNVPSEELNKERLAF